MHRTSSRSTHRTHLRRGLGSSRTRLGLRRNIPTSLPEIPRSTYPPIPARYRSRSRVSSLGSHCIILGARHAQDMHPARRLHKDTKYEIRVRIGFRRHFVVSMHAGRHAMKLHCCGRPAPPHYGIKFIEYAATELGGGTRCPPRAGRRFCLPAFPPAWLCCALAEGLIRIIRIRPMSPYGCARERGRRGLIRILRLLRFRCVACVQARTYRSRRTRTSASMASASAGVSYLENDADASAAPQSVRVEVCSSNCAAPQIPIPVSTVDGLWERNSRSTAPDLFPATTPERPRRRRALRGRRRCVGVGVTEREFQPLSASHYTMASTAFGGACTLLACDVLRACTVLRKRSTTEL
ncbi:hypothetical protein B0H16DRAFT_397127 [Mycena metata]|uniref:Uncharacterized protein n=1 Tax=Mycena metata TaxID=1033252 RepID=A0AAD7JIM8_9AGAR|nr:hypothetical protein B0H16DRAFT_397127 [Mycena metata]